MAVCRCPELCSAGNGKDAPFWWRCSQRGSGMKIGTTLPSVRSRLRSPVRAGTVWHSSVWLTQLAGRSGLMRNSQDVLKPSVPRLRCAIYTRKSTEEGLDQEFNSLDAQREAGEAFIQSLAHFQ